MFVFQTGRTALAWLLLVVSTTSALVFGWLAITQRDWLAGGFSLLCLVTMARMGVLLLRRRAHRGAAVVHEGFGQAQRASSGIFMTRGFHSVGARFRKGVIVVGPSGAAFLPTSGWRFLPIEFFVTALVLRRFEFVDVLVDVPAHSDVNAALHAAAAKYGGFFIDDGWLWTAAQRWLSRPDAPGVISLAQSPSEHLTARWAAGAMPSKAVIQQRLRVAASVGLALATITFVVGLVASRSTGDADYWVAGSFYAGMLVLVVVGVLFVAHRRFGTSLVG